MLKTTPFHARTAALCASFSWRRWAGYAVASSYELTHEREYHAIRSGAALIDISPLYKYSITGKDAARLLDRVVTRDAGNAKAGQVLYTGWCDARGKLLDDGTILRFDENTFRMTSADPNLRWLEDNAAGLDVKVRDVSERLVALALQGPTSRDILLRLVETDLTALKYFRFVETTLRGVPVVVTRTGYTGDLGYEIWLDPDDALTAWDALIETGADHGIVPAGLLALDIARIEAGLMLLDVDYVSARKTLTPAQASSPYELDLAWTVKLAKERFVGRDALAAEEKRGPAWQFVGIELDWGAIERLYADADLAPQLPHTAWRTSVPLYASDRQVGYATSGTWSPRLKKYIALAHVEAARAKPGSQLEMEMTVEHRRKRVAAKVVKKPFFDPDRKRA